MGFEGWKGIAVFVPSVKWWCDVECAIWLPRQDQLQEMSGLNVWQWGFKFSEWLYDLDDDGDCDFHVRHIHEDLHSHEQLAAGFVMKEKHNKVWNGEEWVNAVHTKG